MVLYFSCQVVERLEQFLHGGMFWDKFFCQAGFNFKKMPLCALREIGESEEVT